MAEGHTFRGTFTALVTPMNDEGQIDWDRIGALVERQVEAGVDGLVPVGTTGESPTLTTYEHLEVIKTVVEKAAGRVPVIAGTGANSTEEALHLTREAELIGADAFLQVAPYYNKPSQEGIFQHFLKIAHCTAKPIVLYSIPGRCGVEIAVETVARLAEACPNIRTIKEAGGDAKRVVALRKACPGVAVLSGDDGLILPFIKEGAQGVVSVASNLAPAVIKSLTTAALNGEHEEATALGEEWKSLLTELVFLDGNPVTIKEVLFHAGVLSSPMVRLPLVRMSEEKRSRVRELLEGLEGVSA